MGIDLFLSCLAEHVPTDKVNILGNVLGFGSNFVDVQKYDSKGTGKKRILSVNNLILLASQLKAERPMTHCRRCRPPSYSSIHRYCSSAAPRLKSVTPWHFQKLIHESSSASSSSKSEDPGFHSSTFPCHDAFGLTRKYNAGFIEGITDATRQILVKWKQRQDETDDIERIKLLYPHFRNRLIGLDGEFLEGSVSSSSFFLDECES